MIDLKKQLSIKIKYVNCGLKYLRVPRRKDGRDFSEKNMTFTEVKYQCYPEEKKLFDKNVSLWLYFFIRPASFYPTYLAYRMNISANQTTFVALLIGIASIILAYEGYMLVASLFLNIFAVLDCVDGNLARLRKPTKLGEFLDAISGDIVTYTFVPVFLFSSFRYGYLDHVGSLSSTTIASVIMLITFLQLLSALANQRYKAIFLFNKNQGPLKPISGLEVILRNGYGVAFLWPMSIFTSSFHCFDFFMLYLVLTAPCFYIISIIRALREKEVKF